MYRVFKSLPIFLVFIPVFALAGITDFFKSGTSEALQYDFDIVRLNDLALLSGHIEKYKEITGKYPFQDQTELPHYVHIATKEQEQYAKGGPPYSHKKSSAQSLAKELISKLGPETEIPFDLQRVPTNKPNFYIYMIKGNVYYLAVHVHQDFPFANKIADYYNKVEVTNYQGNNRKGTWRRNELLSNEAYKKARSSAPNKPGYTQELRIKLGANNAF